MGDGRGVVLVEGHNGGATIVVAVDLAGETLLGKNKDPESYH